ncbi:penicillin-binding protein [Loigolactobacillus backii]|uniref:Penicillin-binding protein n=1 Tax=Loigolactobacillus backii TaxID=375175 RepID=A0A192H4L3_9LACO|nr:PBP1A family penicillin-binding protein [Loigolactobacillus backii]ANK62916.1 penicillin-binding protein [Loigolactobacillus backii]ANK70076.1 penicillin-binding protein [Loigolactobacillus backii]
MATNNSRVARNSRQKPKRPHYFRRIFLWLIAIVVAIILLGGGLFTYYAMSAPKVTTAKLSSKSSSVIYDSSGNQIKTLGLENRTYVSGDQIPQTLKDAVVSTEDRHFYTNIGIDPARIVGAAFSNARGESGLQGGSTLTQQLVKLSVFSTKSSDQTLKRKAQEAWLALKVDRTYSKDQILEFYLNKVYLANGVYGMGTAADYYYGKSLSQLNLPQLALIAGMPQAPTTYDPFVNPTAAKSRRDTVLQSMVANKKLTQQQANQAKNTPITDGLKTQAQAQASEKSESDPTIDAYVSQVIAEVKRKTGLNPYTSGLKIHTNLNLDVQKRLYNIVNSNDYVNFPDDLLQTGVTMTNVKNGKVMAMIGGRKQGDVQLGLNRAVQTSRSNGSTMKPMLDYGPAIEYLNYSTYQQINDTKYVYPGTNIQLNDWDFKYMGQISLRTALAQSRNVPAVRTLAKVGINRGGEFLKGLGITPKQPLTLQNAIGAEVSSLQESAAYAAFANGGTYYKPYLINKVEKPDGTTLSFDASGKRAMKKSTAYMITDVLKDVITDGTGTNASISGVHQAGKTGTTNYSTAELQNNTNISSSMSKDSWFTGYTPDYAISVWTGYDQPQQHGLDATDQRIAGSIYQSLMSYAMTSTGASNSDWIKPSSVITENILKGSNPAQIAGSGTSSSTITKELFVRGTQPKKTSKSVSRSSSSGYSSSFMSSSSSSEQPSSSSSSSAESSSQPESSSTESSSSSESSSQSSVAESSSQPAQSESSAEQNTASVAQPETNSQQ